MKAYTVHAPPDDPVAPERLVFIKDGISWPALFVPVLWIFWHRLWLTLVWYLAAILAIAWIDRLTHPDVAAIVAVAGAILFALEGNNFRRWSLAARGWREMGGSFGQNLDEAEIHYFQSWGQPETVPLREKPHAIARAAYSTAAREHGADGPIFGLFPEAER